MAADGLRNCEKPGASYGGTQIQVPLIGVAEGHWLEKGSPTGTPMAL